MSALETATLEGVEKGREETQEKNIQKLQKKMNISYEEAKNILS